MISAITVTRSAWNALALAVILAAVAWWPRFRPQPAAGPDAEIVALHAERDRLAGNTEEIRDRLRAQQAAQQSRAWTSPTLAALQAQLGTGWQWEWSSHERASVRRARPRLEEWREYVALVTALEARPGLVVENVEMRAVGAARSRRFVTVSLGLRFILAVAPIGDAERAAPSRGPLPVAPAEVPAPARKVGPVTALRRPDASAEPPAPGPASASFRPDPPGPSAGIQPNQKPQEKSP
jgi:hypothetical protein